MSRIPYQRSPRVVQPIAETEVEIFKPPTAPSPPTFNAVMIIVPLAMTVAGGGAMFYFSQKMQNSNFIVFQIISMCTVAVSYILPFFMYLQQKKQYQTQLSERETSYKKQLVIHREQLTESSLLFQQQMMTIHPTANQCLNIVEKRARELWERGPTEEDFMSVRIGLGDVRFPVRVKAPRQDGYDQEALINEAMQIPIEFDKVKHTPVLVDMKKDRVIGIVGDRNRVYGVIRFLLMQCATHHSPDELKIASFFRAGDEANWNWMRWLPHTWNDTQTWRMVCKEFQYTSQQTEWLHAVLQRRTMQKGYGSDQKLELPQWLILLTDLRMLEDEPLLPLLMKEGKACGTCTIVVADRREKLPNDCHLVIDVQEDYTKLLQTVIHQAESRQQMFSSFNQAPALVEQTIVADSVRLEEVNHFARRLAPIEVKKAAANDLPDLLTLFDLLGKRDVVEWDIASQWQTNRYPMSLPALVGVRGGSKPIMLNIHDKIERKGHGPHGLVAGTTGSGKSEVIQSLIMSLAVNYHPHDLALMLIDYKGGGMSNIFLELPHVIATVTNLEEEGLIDRSKISLRAELERRQKLFAEAGNVQHIDEYYSTPWKDAHPLPHLLIIIDEFAQLKKDEPEFMSELISIAAIGRTLGVHLLLATQKPGGVVDDKIWSNSRYRICLRVQDESDSRDMLKVPNAAWITHPGRGYIQVGSNELFELVQFAWSGAPYYPSASDEQEASIQVSVVQLNGAMEKVKLPVNEVEVRAEALIGAGKKQKQLQVLIEHVARAAEQRGISRLPGPWMPPLPLHIALHSIRGSEEAAWLYGSSLIPQQRWLKPVVGIVDDMANQQQPPLYIDVSSGHWLLYGMPGTGKTTFVQTFMTALSLDHSPLDVQLYVVDMGRMLRDFTLLPHTGAVIQEDEGEKTTRLIKMLEKELMRRKDLFAETGAKTLSSYREEVGERLPAMILVIDGYATFRTSFAEESERLEPLLREGASFGIYALITANRISDIPDRLRSNFSNALTLMLADNSDYYYAVGRPSKVPSEMPEGRGFVKGKVPPLMFHTALPAEGDTDTSRTKRLRAIFEELNKEWTGDRPIEIATVPARIALTGMLTHSTYSKVALGLSIEELTPFHVRLEDGPYFIVAGRMESGKTSTLLSWSLSLAANMSEEQLKLYLVDFGRAAEGLYGLRQLPHVGGCATDVNSLDAMLGQLEQELDKVAVILEQGKDPADLPAIVLVIDDIDVVAKQLSMSMNAAQRLETLLKRGRGQRLFIIAAGGANQWDQMWDAWVKEIRSGQTGLLLGSTEMSDLQLFQIKLPYDQCNKMLDPGEGFYVKRKSLRVKVAVPDRELDKVLHVPTLK